MSNANVGFVRAEVRAQLSKWRMIRDCVAGEEAVKAATTLYLPKPNAEDTSAENKFRYDSYIKRAVFYNVTRRTLDGLVGQVFMREPVVDLASQLEVLKLDVDGAGVGLNEQAKKALADTMSFGRLGLLVDYPVTPSGTTLAELEKGYIRPTVVIYQPEQIINWRTTTVGGRKLISLLVLQETYTADDDGFEPTIETQWRVLRLSGSPLTYSVEIWREVSSTDGKTKILGVAESFVPLDHNGKPFNEIPFTPIGAINNDIDIDPAPMYDLAVLNIAHYRNSADYEESCFLVGQPTLYAAGLSESWVANVLKGGVQMGSRGMLPLPEGGSAGLLQVDPNSMPKEAMETKERQMVALGARLVEQRAVQRTLGEAQIEESGETSILTSVAKNVSVAFTKALKWCAQFAGGSAEPKFELNTDFLAAKLTPEERAQLIAEWQAGAIAYPELRAQLRKAGTATMNDDAARKEAEKDKELRLGPDPLANPGNSKTGGTNNGRSSPKQNGKTQ